MKAKVLIIDDTPASVMAITAALGDTYDVLTAETGECGLDLARSSDPDVILLDIMLPRMDGYEVCQAIRESPRLSAIPVVMISALDDRASRLASLDAGADEFILKPVDLLELRVRVRTIVRMNRFRRLLEAEIQARRSERVQAALAATAGLGHDFGNYLMTIQGGIDLIERELNGAGAELIAVVNENIDRGAALVKRITGLARGAATMNLRRLPLATFVEGVEPALRHLLGPARLMTNCDVDCAIVADATHLEQALVNLVTNAKQAMDDNGLVTVAVRCENEGPAPTREVSLTVTDTGCGMTPDVQSRIFEPYFTTRGGRGGTGLGLATVHSLVTAQGGRIQLTSAPGEGCAISMTWPCDPRCVGLHAARGEMATRRCTAAMRASGAPQ